MGGLSRRQFIQRAGAGALAVSARIARPGEAAAAAELFDHLGVALYTVREQLRTRPRETFEAIARIGYRYVEGAPRDLEPLVRAAGLAQVSDYAPTYVITGRRDLWAARSPEPLLREGQGWDAVVDTAADRGLKYLVFVYLLPEERGGLDDYRALAAKLNTAGETSRRAGVQLCYHAHSFEFEPLDGVRPLDLMLAETDPSLLALELDTFWASIAGLDPAAYLESHPGRVPLMHLKDKAEGTPVFHDDQAVPPAAFKEIGRGVVDFARVLGQTRRAGLRYCFVEQDHCEEDPFDSLRVSHESLRRLMHG
jgi:sugar phosphate isomerase/epimerase